MLPRRIVWQEKGQGLVEYALILILVAVVVIVALYALAPGIGERLGDIQCSLKYRYQAYVEWSNAEDTVLCYSDVTQPDGSTQKKLLGKLFDEA